MNIPLQKLLLKMEAELQGAKNASSDSALREKIHSLKTLCELVLDEPISKNVEQKPTTVVPAKIAYQAMPVQSPPTLPYQQTTVQSQTSMPNQSKRLEMEDGANGDSLFDF
jgi:hypothetical protein